MKQIISEYFESLMAGNGKSIHTIRSYKGSIDKMVEFFDLDNVSQILSLTENDFIRFYSEKCGKENTLNTHVRNLSAFFNWMADRKYISKDYSFFNVRFGKSRFDKVTKKKRDILTKDEIEMAINAGSNLQEKFMVALAFKTALRRFEIANIQLSDISGCKIRITGKGGDEEYTYLNDRLCRMLKEYLETERDSDSDYLFYGTRGNGGHNHLREEHVNRRIQMCVERAGINKKVSAHTARRTAITRAAVDRNPLAAQILARHKNIQTTMRYVHVGEDVLKDILLSDD